MRRERRRERGAETLEFVACVPLVGLVMIVLAYMIGAYQAKGEADNDARILARTYALCPSTEKRQTMAQIDPSLDTAHGSGWGLSGADANDNGSLPVDAGSKGTVRAQVRVVYGPSLGSIKLPPVPMVSTVTMVREPCNNQGASNATSTPAEGGH